MTNETKFKPENFGPTLKGFLSILEISQAELAKRTNITPAAISQIIDGKRDPSLKTICKILNVIPVSFERFVK